MHVLHDADYLCQEFESSSSLPFLRRDSQQNRITKSPPSFPPQSPGDYDWTPYAILSASDPEAAWNVAEFYGALMVKQLPGKGFGVVATRDVMPGDLIYVGLPICTFESTEFRGRNMVDAMRKSRAWEWVQVRGGVGMDVVSGNW